jgi:hypothetical protein
MFVYLKEAGIGGFKGDYYWSSSAGNRGGAWMQQFSNGEQSGDGNNSYWDAYKAREHLVRAIRQF